MLCAIINKLKEKDEVTFVEDNRVFNIFYSPTNEGYMIYVYENAGDLYDKDGDFKEEYELDDGLCTGSAKDAIEFFL